MGTIYAKDKTGQQFSSSDQNYAQTSTTTVRLNKIQARVDRIHVEGLARTKDDIVVACLQPLFKANSFLEVLLGAQEVRSRLNELKCFKSVAVYVDTNKDPDATEHGLQVTYEVEECNRFNGKFGTDLDNSEARLTANVHALNVCGRGERIEFSYNYGATSSNSFNLAFVKPLLPAHRFLRPLFSVGVTQAHSEWPISGYNQLEQTGFANIAFSYPQNIKHHIQWEATVRHLSPHSNYSTAFEVRKQMGVSLKSAVRHTLTVDTRSDAMLPTSGNLVQLVSEIAGVGLGDIAYAKNAIYVQMNRALVGDYTVQVCAHAGAIPYTMDAHRRHDARNLRICDKVFVGGPLSVRGFQQRAIGPHTHNNNFTGGTRHLELGCHLYAPLPFRPGFARHHLRTHLFVNAGYIDADDGAHAPTTTTSPPTSAPAAGAQPVILTHAHHRDYLADVYLLDQMRISYGLGVVVRLGGVARLELNYVFPYRYLKGDRIQPGIQFGLGVQFL